MPKNANLDCSHCMRHCMLHRLVASAPETILDIEVHDWVSYSNDVTDYTKLATDPNMTTRIVARSFNTFLVLGDIGERQERGCGK
jgi:hypothetical protein